MPRTLTHWGTFDLTVRGGALTEVTPVGEDPDPSTIGQNLHELADHPLRIRRPAVRRAFLDEVESGQRSRQSSNRRRGGEPFV